MNERYDFQAYLDILEDHRRGRLTTTEAAQEMIQAMRARGETEFGMAVSPSDQAVFLEMARLEGHEPGATAASG